MYDYVYYLNTLEIYGISDPHSVSSKFTFQSTGLSRTELMHNSPMLVTQELGNVQALVGMQLMNRALVASLGHSVI